MRTAIKTRLLSTQSDEQLTALSRLGWEPAFETLVRRHRRPLLRHCRQLCLSEERAEQVLAETLSEAWGDLQAGAEVQELRPWLQRIAQRIAADAIPATADGRAGSEGVSASMRLNGAPRPDEVLALRGALASMAALPKQDAVVIRRANGNKIPMPGEDAFQLADGAVKGLLGRARRGISALTPAPLLQWAASRASQGSGTGQRIAELGAGGGAGLAGLAVKGGVAAITAGVAITGSVIVATHHSHASGAQRHRAGQVASSLSSAGAGRASAGGSGDLTSTGAPASAGRLARRAPHSHRHGGAGLGGARHGAGGAGAGTQVTGESVVAPGTQVAETTPSGQGDGSGSSHATGSQGGREGQQTSSEDQQGKSDGGSTSPVPGGQVEVSTSGASGSGIGVQVSLEGGSSQQTPSSSSGTSGSGSSTETSSASGGTSSGSESQGAGIGITVSLEPLGSVGAHVSLP